MRVRDLMSTDILCIKEDATLFQAASYMRNNNIGSLPVCDDAGHLKGIITDRDIIVRAIARCSGVRGPHDAAALTGIHAADIMSTGMISVSPDASIHDAALLLAHYKIRRLPVTEASRIVGMLSLGDIASKPVHIDEAGDALSSISITESRQ